MDDAEEAEEAEQEEKHPAKPNFKAPRDNGDGTYMVEFEFDGRHYARSGAAGNRVEAMQSARVPTSVTKRPQVIACGLSSIQPYKIRKRRQEPLILWIRPPVY